jgi:Rad3-related DNA helicase
MLTPDALSLPYTSWRTGQCLAIRTALKGKKRFTVIQAPTGSGKSLVAAACTRLVSDTTRTMILTATNALLDQYSSSFDCLAQVKGAGRYECLAATSEHRSLFPFGAKNVKCDEGACRIGATCTLKSNGCLYFDALRRAMTSNAPVTNYAYWLSMRRFAEGLGRVDRLICDEAHTLPDELMGAFQIVVPRSELGRTKAPKTIEEWKTWAGGRLTASQPATDEATRLRQERRRNALQAIVSMLDEDWVVEMSSDTITFEPTVPSRLTKFLADESTNVVCLSATITPSVLQLLGIEPSEVESLVLRSSFPLSSRPVYVVPGVRVDFRMESHEKQYWVERMDQILDSRSDRKGLIHTVSYKRQREYVSASRHRSRLVAPDARQTVHAVEQFRKSARPLVLVGPQFEQGFDFPYTDCEFIVVAKLPFPDTRSPIMKARIERTERYRSYHTVQRLVQMCGRAMRAEDDRAEVFIVDDHVRWFLPRERDLMPDWFLDAVQWERRLPPPSEKL